MLNPRILVKRAMALGDVLLVTPIVYELYQRYNGNCEITVATNYPDVFKNNPHVHTVIPMHAADANQYDATYNLDMAYEKFPKIHILDAYKKFVFGDTAEIEPRVRLYPTKEDEMFARGCVKEYGLKKYVVMHMRHVDNVDGRNISTDIWADIIEDLLDNTEAKIVQIGSANDLSFNGDPRLINALGKYTLHHLYDVINYADVFVGADSAPLHIASAGDTPIVGLFSTVKAKYREPKGRFSDFIPIATNLPCYGCKENIPPPHVDFSCHRGDYACTSAFDPLKISAEIKKYLVDTSL